MALEVRNIKAENTHENKQFRRVATQLIQFFDQKNWDGILIGNPDSENFQHFRADALLLYDYGLLVIDFKDYGGVIDLPKTYDEFINTDWYIDTDEDKNRIIIKAGAYHANPFRQLRKYRSEFFDLISSDITLSKKINPRHVCAMNIFTGPIEIKGKTPGKLRYYTLTSEEDLLDFLVDYSSDNYYSQEAHNALLRHFPAELWEPHNVIDSTEQSQVPSSITEIDGDLKIGINDFLSTESSGILVLKSMNSDKRDNWMRYILENGNTYNTSQIETWVHSTRIARRVKLRSNISVSSMYASIYGGRRENDEEEIQEQEIRIDKELFAVDESETSLNLSNDNKEKQSENPDEELQVEEIPLASDKDIDESAVVIIQDAHLVTSSVHRSDLLLFGTGRILTDFIQFMRLEKNNRKIIFIGDPYSLSYGKISESALIENHLATLYAGNIQSYNDSIDVLPEDGIEGIRGKLANAIKSQTFNQLSYSEDDNEVILSVVDTSQNYFQNWFSQLLSSEPKHAGLFYKRESAFRANLHIKEQYLKNTDKLNSGDLLLIDNNVWIPDDSGFTAPLRIFNGMYVLVKELIEEKTISIEQKGSSQNILLEFIKLKVCCISLDSNPLTELWLNKNYFDNLGKLSIKELLAFKIFRNIRLSNYKKENSFELSLQFKKLNVDNGFIKLKEEINQLESRIAAGERVKTKLEETKRKSRKIERKYKKEYDNEVSYQVMRNDPFINAINACYGWCITVHKAVGAKFKEVVFNVNKGLSQGIINEDYFRWVYSGITTANDKVYITNSNEIDPFMNCSFEDFSEEGWKTSSNQQSKNLEFKEFNTPLRFIDIIETDLNINAKGAIVHFASSIESEGILLLKTRKFGDYLSKAFFSTPNDAQELIMVFNNNGKGLITSIRPERNGEPFQSQIEKAILDVKRASQSKVDDSQEVKIPEDFRKGIYEDWINRCSSSGAKLTLIGCFSYHDILIYTKGEHKIKIKLIYNGKGMFSHIKVLAKTNSNISIELYELIFNGD